MSRGQTEDEYSAPALSAPALVIAPYTSRELVCFPWSRLLLRVRVGESWNVVLHGPALSHCCRLTSSASLCSTSKFFAFDAFRASSSSSLASVSFSYLSTQYSSFSSTFCVGQGGAQHGAESTGERFAAVTHPAVSVVVRVQ